MPDRIFDIVSEEAIAEGRATAAYFLRTEEVLDHAGANPRVVAELNADVADWHVLAGLKDAAHLLDGLPIDVDAIPEGTLFRDIPVLRIEGRYRTFARYEQSLLGFIAHASGVATSAMRVRTAARDATVLSFGTRRQHPASAAMIERSALIGGADGIGHVAAGEVIGVDAGGTMPHALVLCLDDPETAWEAYDRALPSEVPRVMLCDTFGDEADEAVRAAEFLGDGLDGVRLDTPASRRGDMRAIVEEVRWELDARGFDDVDILVSGGIGPVDILELRGVADAFGVGGAIANADPVDFSLNIVEVDGDPVAKRGVKSGTKDVYREGGDDVVVPAGTAGSGDSLLEPVIRDGELVMAFSIDSASERVRDGLAALRERGAAPVPDDGTM